MASHSAHATLAGSVVRGALLSESVDTSPMITWYAQTSFVRGPFMASHSAHATLAGARTVMPGWERSTPFAAHAETNVEKVSYSLRSDSSFMGSCSGPSGPQKTSGPWSPASMP